MALRDTFSNLCRKRDWAALHDALDAASPGGDSDERCCIAHWRSAALSAQGRCLEAIDALTASRNDFYCKTLVSMKIAENLHRLGRDAEAIEELKTAPMAEEAERYRALVLDAKYVLAHLMAINRMAVEQALLDEIPETYIHIDYRGRRISKTDLLHRISRNVSSCGCGTSP